MNHSLSIKQRFFAIFCLSLFSLGALLIALPAFAHSERDMQKSEKSKNPMQFQKTIVDNDGNVGKNTAIALGEDGFPVISYLDDAGKVKFAACSDAKCSDAVMKTIDTVDDFFETPIDMAIGEDGNPLILYSHTDAAELRLAVCSSATCSDVDVQVVTSIEGSTFVEATIAIGSDGMPMIVYGKGAELHVVHCTAADCSATDEHVTFDPIDYQTVTDADVVIGSDGLPFIRYYAYLSTDGKYRLSALKCSDELCTDGTTTVLTEVDGDYSEEYGSLALDADDVPVLTYVDAEDGDQSLYVARCQNVSCSDVKKNTVVSKKIMAKSSVAVKSNGMPVIAYALQTGKKEPSYSLRLLVCKTESCSEVSRKVVDSRKSVGTHNSLLVDSENRLMMAYYFSSDSALKYALGKKKGNK